MGKFIKQSEFYALQAKSDEIKKERGIKSLKDEIEYALSQPGFYIEKLIIVPDDEWDNKTHEELDWGAAVMEIVEDEKYHFWRSEKLEARLWEIRESTLPQRELYELYAKLDSGEVVRYTVARRRNTPCDNDPDDMVYLGTGVFHSSKLVGKYGNRA